MTTTGEQRAPAVVQGLRHARIAASIGFFIFGLSFAIWAVHIPTMAAKLEINTAILGLALLNVGLGGVISQPITGWLTARIGSATATRIFLPLFMVAACAPIVAWNIPGFFAGTLILGLAAGATNVAINTQASEIEAALGRPTMSSFHGFFSLGALAGALIGGAIVGADLDDGTGAVVLGVVLFAIAGVASRYFMTGIPREKRVAATRARFAMPPATVLGLAILTFFSNAVEGSVNDWSALYLASVRGFSDATAATGFAAFSLAMAICRLAGGPVVAKLGEQRIVLFGGLLMALGMGVVVLSPWSAVSPFGFALVAVGAANTIPVMISAASRTPGIAPSSGVAVAATGALLGFLIGPPVIGFIAHIFGLSVSLGTLAVAGLIIAIGAWLHKWQSANGNRGTATGRE